MRRRARAGAGGKSSRPPAASRTPASRKDEEVSSARDYYRKILPFYEKESVVQAHLDFWVGIARGYRPGRILEIGAGFGRITEALSRVAPAVGMDVSLEMLSLARGREGTARDRAVYVAADARRVAFDRSFDLIVAPGDPISHMTSPADRRATLRAVARQLSPRGVFVLEGLWRPRRESPPRTRRVTHAGGELTIEDAWSPIRGTDLWRARYRYRDRRRDGSVRTTSAAFVARAWDPSTVRRLFRSCGLRILETWGGFDRRPFGEDSRRLFVVAQRASGP